MLFIFLKVCQQEQEHPISLNIFPLVGICHKNFISIQVSLHYTNETFTTRNGRDVKLYPIYDIHDFANN